MPPRKSDNGRLKQRADVTEEASQESLRFADLVRARELQQEKLREALLHQNIDLRRKLEETLTPQRSNSSSARDEAPVDPPVHTPTFQETQHFREEPPQSAPVHDSASSRPPHTLASGVEADFASVIQTMRDMIAKASDVQLAALAKHEAMVNQRLDGMQRSIDDLHEAMHRDELQRAVLRDEQTTQILELSAEIDRLRERLDRMDTEASSAKETVGASSTELMSSLATQQAVLQQISSRLTLLEELPSKVKGLEDSTEERLKAVTAVLGSERSSDAVPASDMGNWDAFMRAAEQRLAQTAEAAASAFDVRAQRALDTLEASVREATAEAAQQLEQLVAARAVDTAEQLERRQSEVHKELQDSFATLEASFLSSMRQDYQHSLDEQLQALVRQAEDFEKQRRVAMPALEEDRVNVMVAELQSASVVLEGVLSAVANDRGAGGNHQVLSRLDELQARLVAIEARIGPTLPQIPLREAIAPRRTTTSVVEPGVSYQRVERPLGEELDSAAGDTQLASSRRKSTASSPSPSSARRRREADLDYDALGVDAIRERITTKEKLLGKVQTFLRNISAAFHALTEHERSQGDAWSRQKIEEVIRQKDEMHLRERQLVDQRNHLMAELAELRDVLERRTSY